MSDRRTSKPRRARQRGRASIRPSRLAAGKTSREVGEILQLSELTVNNHVGRILRKFNAATRTQAIALAVQTGQIDRDR